jgi:phosphoribosylformylglycinamidine synthase
MVIKMVFRCYTAKKEAYAVEAANVLSDIRTNLAIRSVNKLRIYNRYDVEGIDKARYELAKTTVFSEPPCDECFDELLPEIMEHHWILAVEALPGQYDQRADSCAQCIQMLDCSERPAVAYAKLYVFYGDLSSDDKDKIIAYLINPVEARMARLDKPETIISNYPEAEPVKSIEGFISADDSQLEEISEAYSLAMDMDDLRFMQHYFRDEEKRDPTVTELKVIDTYWSDHCRHTTFGTQITALDIEDAEVKAAYDAYLAARREVYGEKAESRPITLMDMATIAAKLLKKRGELPELDISEEINACSIHVDAKIDGKTEDWLLMFKNETHNHPTEIEPFGGAATCIGGAIRDPLSGRAYVYQAMRVTGAGDPTVPLADTLPGKLPQRKITTTAAAGYSSYGNQIGLSTGLVHEIYHPNYVAKRMEVGAVVGAAPVKNVVRLTPEPGDLVILLGGRTGRDGCGGATGSSKIHDLSSLSDCAAEVQKGNAPEERKIQRLFRNGELSRMIKRCNDFGAGGVSVAIGELADGIEVNLDKVTKKYEGLDGTELAISESQERMAVVVAKENAEKFISICTAENIEANVVAEVTDKNRMVMHLHGKTIVDISRDFLSSNGADKFTQAAIPQYQPEKSEKAGNAADYLISELDKLEFCSQRGLGERFDGSIGAGSVLMPYGGKTQRTPSQVMAALLPAMGKSETCSVMSFAFDPWKSSANPFRAAYNAVALSMTKLVAAGCDHAKIYMSFQEYFEKLKKEPLRWGKPAAALLGALKAQLDFHAAAIGGKDSMSGSFMDIDVPPTLISFAIAPNDAASVISSEFKSAGNRVYLIKPGSDTGDAIISAWKRFEGFASAGKILSSWAVCEGGVIGGIFKMAVGNNIGFASENDAALLDFTTGAIIAEATDELPGAIYLGKTAQEATLKLCGKAFALDELVSKWESKLEGVFPTLAPAQGTAEKLSFTEKKYSAPAIRCAKPQAVIPVFPGTNCEYDTMAAVEDAGGAAKLVLIRNISSDELSRSADELAAAIAESQMLIVPGGFSGGDEPEGSGKFIAAFLRNPNVAGEIMKLLKSRDGLVLGICNGFQALIKLGLVPYGEIRPLSPESPTLTFNNIGRHQSRYVTTRIASVNSPWLAGLHVGDEHTIAISHGEGKFVAPENVFRSLVENGQIATQYVDFSGEPSMDISANPNGSLCAVEGILSPDGRVLGKMGHTERRGKFVAKNIYGDKFQPIFENGIAYFK